MHSTHATANLKLVAPSITYLVGEGSSSRPVGGTVGPVVPLLILLILAYNSFKNYFNRMLRSVFLWILQKMKVK